MVRKTRKFAEQGDRLLLPAFELMLLYNGFDAMPEPALQRAQDLIGRHIDDMESQLPELASFSKAGLADLANISSPSLLDLTPASHFNTDKLPYPTYFDDLSLLHLIRANINRQRDPRKAIASFRTVFAIGRYIELDHWYIPFAHIQVATVYADGGEGMKGGEWKKVERHVKKTKELIAKKKLSLERQIEFQVCLYSPSSRKA